MISLLNAFTGLTVAAGGYVLQNTVLLVAGTLVGASGTFLTLLMARAMGRSVANILFGALKGGSTLGAGEASDRPVRSATPEDAAIMLNYADRVIIVPGYGLAVAQAQHSLRELVDVLNERGGEVDYAIHPVAGRMPGHMNVLLAEAQVPYEQLHEMDDINGDFKDTDVVLIVGANDVVNPAAKTTPGAPIYGMPILNADEARQIIFMKRSMRPGFAGIENELLFDEKTHAAVRRRQGLDGQAAERREGALSRVDVTPSAGGRWKDMLRRFRFVAAPLAVLLAVGAAPSQADPIVLPDVLAPIDSGHLLSCTELVPHAIAVDNRRVRLDLRILLDGVQKAKAQPRGHVDAQGLRSARHPGRAVVREGALQRFRRRRSHPAGEAPLRRQAAATAPTSSTR